MTPETLNIFCADELALRDRLTFDSILHKGMQVTFWFNESGSIEVLDAVFDILFDGVMRMRENKRGGEAWGSGNGYNKEIHL